MKVLKHTLLVLLFLASSFFYSGCKSDGISFKVGTIELERLFSGWPKALELREKYQEEYFQMITQLPQNPEELTINQKAKIKDSSDKFKKEQEKLLDEVRIAAKDVAKQKKLQLVIINIGSVHYGGVDVTREIGDVLK